MQTGSSCSRHCCHTRSSTLLRSEFDEFIDVGECLSTKLFIISIPWAAWTNELFQPNNSAIGERYWTQLQHRIIHRQQRGAKQLGSHLHYENEKQSLVKEHYTHATQLPLFQLPVKWSCTRVQHKNDINQTLVPDHGKCIDSVLLCIIYVILAQKTSWSSSINTVYVL